MKVAELEGALLDYWVARAEGANQPRIEPHGACTYVDSAFGINMRAKYSPSTDWSIGGPILERALISVLYGPVDAPGAAGYWSAFIRPSDEDSIDGPTYLVAGMRAYVASMFGEVVEDTAHNL